MHNKIQSPVEEICISFGFFLQWPCHGKTCIKSNHFYGQIQKGLQNPAHADMETEMFCLSLMCRVL